MLKADFGKQHGRRHRGTLDALAIARAFLREPHLPAARLDDESREVRLLVDHREALVAERTRIICRLRWHVHELDPSWDPPARSLILSKHLAILQQRIAPRTSVVARLALELITCCRELTSRITALEVEIENRVALLAPALLRVGGCGALTAAKIIGETAGVARFRSKDAYARHNGTAPLPVWSGNRQRHRLCRSGNRQLNAALHRIAVTQARHHGAARDYLARRRSCGNNTTEALRSLKRPALGRRLPPLLARGRLRGGRPAALQPVA